MTTDLDDLDIIGQAAAHIAAQIRTAEHIQDIRETNPGAHPDYGPRITALTVATRAVGELLKAGLLVTPLTPGELESLRLNRQPMDAYEAAEIRRRYRRMGGQG